MSGKWDPGRDAMGNRGSLVDESVLRICREYGSGQKVRESINPSYPPIRAFKPLGVVTWLVRPSVEAAQAAFLCEDDETGQEAQ